VLPFAAAKKRSLPGRLVALLRFARSAVWQPDLRHQEHIQHAAGAVFLVNRNGASVRRARHEFRMIDTHDRSVGDL